MEKEIKKDGPERIPREKMHEQNDRLTTKHVHTLQFVQEVARENTELKKKIGEYEEKLSKCQEIHAIAEESQERLQKLQAELLHKSDRLSSDLSEKHREEIMKLVEERLQLEEHMKLRIAKKDTELQALESENKKLMLKLEGQAVLESRIQEEQKLRLGLQDEIAVLRKQLEELRHQTRRSIDAEELDMMRQQYSHVTNELREAQQKNIELNFRIGKLEKEAQEGVIEQDKIQLIENLKIKVSQMQTERAVALERERNHEKKIKELEAELSVVKQKLLLMSVEKNKIMQVYHKALEEIEKMRQKIRVDSAKNSFRDYVQLKREFEKVKIENDQLRKSAKKSSLPMLKDSHHSGDKPDQKVRRSSAVSVSSEFSEISQKSTSSSVKSKNHFGKSQKSIAFLPDS